jgi:hypothetical protein
MAETSSARDITLVLTIPVGGDGTDGTGDSSGVSVRALHRHGPWGGPETPLAQEVLQKADALITVLQRAHRECVLAEAGVCELEALQRFYVALKCQLEKKPHGQ